MAGRLSPEHHEAQKAITVALEAANARRGDSTIHAKCISYASRIIDRLRRELDTVDPRTDRAWRD